MCAKRTRVDEIVPVDATSCSNVFCQQTKIDSDDDLTHVILPLDGHDELRCVFISGDLCDSAISPTSSVSRANGFSITS